MVLAMGSQVMRNASHRTLIAILLHHVNEWRRREGWSRETVVQCIVEAHERIEGPAVTEIRFDCATPDQFQRMKNNADRIFRWLDDQTKDTNLLPANFIPSVLAAMPDDIKCICANELLLPACLASYPLSGELGDVDVGDLFKRVLKEANEAQQAIAGLLDGHDRDELLHIQQQTNEAIEALQQVRTKVGILLTQGS